MYTIIADIGSSKSTWTALNKTSHKTFTTKGFNPNYQSKTEIQNILSEVHSYFCDFRITSCSIYGAGIDQESSKLVLSDLLHKIFKHLQSISIENDLLAAARSCYSDSESGVIAILGTGSNVKLYRNGVLHGESHSLGYILGDEGAGVAFGKEIVKALVYQNFPKEIIEQNTVFNISKSEIIDRVYKQPYPQQFLAQFAKFCHPYKTHPFIKGLLIKNFKSFIETHLLKIKEIQNKDIKFVGSMAFYFREALEIAAKEHQINIKQISQNPQNGLISYHKNKL